jgi:hypothetical protein
MVSWYDQDVETRMIVPDQLSLDYIPFLSGGDIVIENITRNDHCCDIIARSDIENIVNYRSLAL